MKIGFTAINSEKMFVLFENGGKWYQAKVPHNQIIWYMQHEFPGFMKQIRKYQFDTDYQIAKWLYNYGDCPDGDTYIFNDLDPHHYCEFDNAKPVPAPKHITYCIVV